MHVLIYSFLALSLTLGSSAAPSTNTCLPIVDLGYERHQALSYNETTKVYKFQNIRYAQNPTHNLRFRAPLPPKTNRTHVQNGAEFRMCPQGVPAWQGKAYKPIAKYSNPSVPFNLKDWEEAILNGTVPSGDPNKGASEDCLFLDVHVPKGVLGRGGKHGAPVLVWIHGGGFALGSKLGTPTGKFDPSGLLMHAAKGKDDMIFVSLNYRLGALGFLAGPEVKKDGTLNAGLLDQRLALEWVQQNIHLFGGAKDRVTVMGESGGASSILLHMTARGGKDPTPFSQAIAQSPATIPTGKQEDSSFGDFLTQLNVENLTEARKVDEKTIIAANAAQIGGAPTTTYIFGPVIDGDYIPREPISMVKPNHLDSSVKVMTGHNSFEGAFFFDPTVKTEEQFKNWLARSLPGLSENSQKHLMETLYPAQFDGSLGYIDQDTRQMRLWSEAVIDCNYELLTKAIKNKGYAYEFGVSPGFHIQDLDYTFNSPFSPAAFPEAQDSLQTAIVSFVQKGVPMMRNGRGFPHPGLEGTLVNITSTGEEVVGSKVNVTRCAWWGDLDVHH